MKTKTEGALFDRETTAARRAVQAALTDANIDDHMLDEIAQLPHGLDADGLAALVKAAINAAEAAAITVVKTALYGQVTR